MKIKLFTILICSSFFTFSSECIDSIADILHSRYLINWKIDLSNSRKISGYDYSGKILGSKERPLLLQLKHKSKMPLITHKNLLIRPFKETDSKINVLNELGSKHFLDLWQNIDNIEDLLTPDGVYFPSIILGQLELTLSFNLHTAELVEQFIIEDQNLKEAVGFIGSSLDMETKKTTIQYGIFQKYRSKGYAKNALEGLVNHLQQTKKAIYAQAKKSNAASINILKSIGFKKIDSFHSYDSLDHFLYRPPAVNQRSAD